MQCSDECCKGGEKTGKKKTSTRKVIAQMKQNIGQLKRLVQLAKNRVGKAKPSVLQNQTSLGFARNSAPSKLVKKLQANLRVLEKKLKDAKNSEIEKFENNGGSFESDTENFENSNKSMDTEMMSENSETESNNADDEPNKDTYPTPRKPETDSNWTSEKQANSSTYIKSHDTSLESHIKDKSVASQTPLRVDMEKQYNKTEAENIGSDSNINANESRNDKESYPNPRQPKTGPNPSSEKQANYSTFETYETAPLEPSIKEKTVAVSQTPLSVDTEKQHNQTDTDDYDSNDKAYYPNSRKPETNSNLSSEKQRNSSLLFETAQSEPHVKGEAVASQSPLDVDMEKQYNKSDTEYIDQDPNVNVSKSLTMPASDFEHNNKSAQFSKSVSGINSSEENLGLKPVEPSLDIDKYYNRTANNFEIEKDRNHSNGETQLDLTEPDFELDRYYYNSTAANLGQALKTSNSSVISAKAQAEPGMQYNATNDSADLREKPSNWDSTDLNLPPTNTSSDSQISNVEDSSAENQTLQQNQTGLQSAGSSNAHDYYNKDNANSTFTGSLRGGHQLSAGPTTGSMLNKAAIDLDRYYNESITNIDDGLSTHNSSQSQDLSNVRTWNHNINETNSQSDSTEEASLSPAVVPEDKNENYSSENEKQAIDNENQPDEDEQQSTDSEELHDPEAESEIDGSDLFKDESMQSDDNDDSDVIDAGISEHSLNSQRVGYQGQLGKKRDKINPR